jgi:hypothetical protein
VEGETIADHIARGPIPASEAVPLFIQIARGLEAAHGYFDWGFNYDLFRDGQRILMVKAGPPLKLRVSVNWFSELKRLAATD